jgi:hypothetical protein
MLVRAPRVKAEQHCAIAIDDLSEMVVNGCGCRYAKQ